MSIKNTFVTTLAAVTLIQTAVWGSDAKDSDQSVAIPEIIEGLDFETEEIAAASKADKKTNKIASLKGVFVTSNRDDIIPKGRPKIKGVEFKDFQYPDDEKSLRNIIHPFLSKPLTPQLLADLRGAIVQYYKSTQHPTARVLLPQQTASNGVIQLLISTYKLGKTIYTGNQWYSSDYLSRFLHISPGQEISEDVLLNDLSWINRNPFHKANVKFVPSSTPGVMDLQISAKDRSPLRYYFRGDNTGSDSTGNIRYAAGFSWGNAFWLGDIMTYEYSTSNEVKRVQLHKFNYTSFLPWKHVVLLFGSYNNLKPIVPKAKSKSISYQSKIRYTIPFKPLYTVLAQDFTFGGDFKHTNSNTISLQEGAQVEQGIPPVIRTINVTMFYMAYTMSTSYIAGENIGKHNINLSLESWFSPCHFLDHQNTKEYNLNRPFSRPRFAYAYLTLGDTYYLPMKFALAALLRVQRAYSTLPSTELFGLGGYNTVRGYKERVFNTDNGLIFNFEVRSPPIMCFPKLKDKLLFLGFVDYGIGNNFHPAVATKKFPKDHATQFLLSAGGGLRYNINPYLAARIDYGFKLHEMFSRDPIARLARNGYGRWHIGVLLSY